MRFSTKAIHVGSEPDPTTGATIPPIYATSTYTQASPARHKGYEYSRTQNPTRNGFEKALAALEEGAACAAFASGSAATHALFLTLRPDDEVVAYADLYGGTYRLLERVHRPWKLNARYTDDTAIAAFKALVTPKTKLIWVETPTNPLLRIMDIAALAELAHAHSAKLAVDNTFATPALQRPIALGADYVIHSTTKYIGGHSDVVGGALVVKHAADLEPISFYQNAAGGVPGPFDIFLTHRGLKTLAIRMAAHCQNATAIAERFNGHPKIEKLIYPGLQGHPDHRGATSQMSGFGGIVTLVLRGGFEAARRLCERTRVFSLAESLGGVESLINHPATMTHASIPRELREARGVVDGLVRLSVGIEDAEDLIEDLHHALA